MVNLNLFLRILLFKGAYSNNAKKIGKQRMPHNSHFFVALSANIQES